MLAGLSPAVVPEVSATDFGRASCSPLDELLELIADAHGWQIVAKEVMPDHVHLFVRVGPTDAPAQVVRAFKGAPRGCFARSSAPTQPREGGVVTAVFRRFGRLRVRVDGAPLHRASVGCGGFVRRAYVFRLRPTARQHVALAACVESHRELYNAALQERRDAWSHSNTRINYGDQSAQLTEIRAAARIRRCGRFPVSRPRCAA